MLCETRHNDAVTSAVHSSRAFGRVVGIRTSMPWDAVLPALPHWWAETTDEPDEVFDVDPETTAIDIRAIEYWLAEHARGVVFIHAGVVAVDGRALLLPGLSYAGKSELTAALLVEGAEYGSDEYAVLHPDGTVEAYPRRLSLRSVDAPGGVAAGTWGASTFTGRLAVHAVADLRYAPEDDWATTPLTSGQTVLRLIDNAAAAQTQSVAVLDAAVAATGVLGWAIQGTRGEAHLAATRLLAMLRERP